MIQEGKEGRKIKIKNSGVRGMTERSTSNVQRRTSNEKPALFFISDFRISIAD
jgi:hypothetical protein